MFDYVKISFPSAGVQPTIVHEFNFYQERGKHEFATLKLRDWDFPYESIKPGTPATFTLKSVDGSRDFNGYIHHITPNITPGSNWIEVHLIGASYHLKQASQQIYKNVTATDVVKTIAKRVGFAFNVVNHPRIYKQIAQAGLTDLEMLHKLAKQCGYSLRLQNAEIHFQPVTKVYDELKASARIFTRREQSSPDGSTLYSFTPHIGESLDQEGEHKSAVGVNGVDSFTGKLIKKTNQTRPKASKRKFEPEYFDSFATSVVINDQDMAKHESVSADERVRYPYRATAEVLGSADLHPDSPVYLEGISQEYGGYWTVLGTEHKVTSKSHNLYQYTTVLYLGTDSLGQDIGRPGSPASLKPTEIPQRTIIPGVRQTNKKPVALLKSGTLNPSPKKNPVGFGIVNNRPRPTVANKTIVAKKWTSPSGDLRAVQIRTSPSQTVVQHLRNLGVR